MSYEHTADTEQCMCVFAEPETQLFRRWGPDRVSGRRSRVREDQMKGETPLMTSPCFHSSETIWKPMPLTAIILCLTNTLWKRKWLKEYEQVNLFYEIVKVNAECRRADRLEIWCRWRITWVHCGHAHRTESILKSVPLVNSVYSTEVWVSEFLTWLL